MSGSGQLSEEALGEAQRHVESCQDCSQKLQRHKFVQREILRMRAPIPSPPTPECMGDAEWLDVAAGLLPEAKITELMKHAAHCGHCGPLLKNAAEGIADEATPSEEALLESLPSARPAWRKNMAAALRDSARDDRQTRQPKPSWWSAVLAWPTPAYAFAGIAALALVAWIGVRALRPPSAEQLLAQAYTEHRTLEVRIPGAKYAPMQAERGAQRSDFDKPQSLLKAEDLIGENLRKNPNDPAWLQARARAELLDGNYESAIKALQRALESQPDSASLLTDLGSAYYLRAESADRPIDYGNAIESFGKALAKSPDDPIALFNRALACERMFLYTQAVDDWEHYLRVDPQGEWAEEARKRLAALKEKLELHEKSENEPLLTPAEIAKASSDADLRNRLNQRIEDYLSLATTEWLLKAYPAGRGETYESGDYRSALRVLAQVLSQDHGDLWLADLLSDVSTPDFSKAIENLTIAVQADESGNNELGIRNSREAEHRFIVAGNTAGASRARVEYVFASHDARDARSCLQAANRSELSQLSSRSYRWLTIQFHIEQGTCYTLAGKLGLTRQLYELAADGAKAAGYRVIYLRTQDHLSSLGSQDGDWAEGWARTRQGLKLFWAGQYPAMRGYNFYFNLYEFSRLRAQPHLQMAAWRDGVALSESFSDKLLRAMAHSLMGSAAVAAGETGTAEVEFERSSELFKQSPQIASTRIAHIEAEGRLAEVETREGKPQLAVARLRQYGPEVAQLSDSFLGILYETALANAEATAGNGAEAESALRSALGLAEFHLKFIHDDGSRIEWAQRAAEAYRHFAQLRLLQGDVEGALEIWEWYRGAALREGRSKAELSASEASLPQRVAEEMPRMTDATVVAYALLPEGVAIWVYDDRGVFSHWSEGSGAVILARAEHFRALCADPKSDILDVQQSGRWLYDALIAPVEQHLSADRTLLIELDDGISGLPFDALLDSQNRYFGDRYTAVSSLGLYYLPAVRRKPLINKDSRALIVSVARSRASTNEIQVPLPDVVSEGEMVARNFTESQLLAQESATVNSVLTRLPSVAVFHFAGHAVSSAVQSGLLLSDDLLNTSSFGKVALPQMRLAVFSACDTQDNDSGSADNMVGAFLRAGAAQVVASRWNIDSGVTREFMELFYRSLLAGNTVGAALREAKSGVRSRPGLSHPYYWSAFTAFGAV